MGGRGGAAVETRVAARDLELCCSKDTSVGEMDATGTSGAFGLVLWPFAASYAHAPWWWNMGERVEVHTSSGGSHIFAHSPRITPRISPKASACLVYPGIIFAPLIRMHLWGGRWGFGARWGGWFGAHIGSWVAISSRTGPG